MEQNLLVYKRLLAIQKAFTKRTITL